MHFIDDLREDHDLIERVAGAFLTFGRALDADPGVAADLPRFIRFFTDFAGQCHHAREEETLFAALQARAGLPAHGPIAALTGDHRRLAQLLESVRNGTAIGDYVYALWRHIDAENSVLLPEGEARLRKQGVRELEGRPPTPSELAARDEGVALLSLYAPTLDDAAALRGDGCVCCPMMTVSCAGLEHAWWSEHEWDEFQDHLAGD